ncbi:MAG: cobalt ECF transporter T component CbiQ [Anaerolineae bacterium]|nr:cobalt ECF transporter T component CbiQ [Anaerolineae bacterium]
MAGEHLHALDGYRARTSPVHHLDARVKLVLALLFILSAVLTPTGAWPAYILLTALVWSAIILSQVGMGFVQRRTAVVMPFALAAVTVIFTTPGRPVLTVWKFDITDHGLLRLISILLKSWLSIQAAVLLTACTPFPALLQAMSALRIPRVLVVILGFTYRYIFVIGDEALRLIRGRAARSGDLNGKGGGTLLWRARVTGNMAGSLFLRSIERSERVYAAMLARGYDGQIRTLNHPTVRPSELVLMLAGSLLLVLIQLLARLRW